MTSSDGTFKCHYVSALNEWHIDKEDIGTRYYSPNGTDNPWDATNWYEYSAGFEDRNIKVELNQSSGSSSAGDVLVVSGSYQSDEYGNYSPGAADGEYTLKDTSATGTERVWQNENKTFEFRYYEMRELWMLVHGNNGEYDHYTYRGDNGHNDPVNSDGSSVVWKLQGMDSNMKVVKK